MLHGFEGEGTCEEQNLQDYQKRKEEEKGRNGKLHMKNLLGKRRMWMERRPVDGLGMVS